MNTLFKYPIKLLAKALIVGVGLFATVNTYATGSVSATVTNGGNMINLLPLTSSGYAKVSSIVVISTSTNTANVAFVDTSTNSLVYTNGAYTNYYSYATNVVTIWTNYFGATNSFTNLAMVLASNSVPAGNFAYPVRATVFVTTNATAVTAPVSYIFENGVWLTNSGGGPATVTINYIQ